MKFMRGMREKISKFADVDSEICIEMGINGPSIYDFCCFGVDKSGKLSDERYMIFYNQISSPNHELSFVSGNNSAKFYVNLSKLPLEIDKLVFTASIDGNGTMGEISGHSFYLSQNNDIQISMELSGSDFMQEKAIISIEIYRKDEWRIAAVAKGFNGGLSALLAAQKPLRRLLRTKTALRFLWRTQIPLKNKAASLALPRKTDKAKRN